MDTKYWVRVLCGVVTRGISLEGCFMGVRNSFVGGVSGSKAPG